MTKSPDPVPDVTFTVLGHLQSMKNRRIPSRRNPYITLPNAGAVSFERDFLLQVPATYRDLKLGTPQLPLRAEIHVWYPTLKNDLDCALVYDLLQKAGVIANDRYIREKHEFAGIDPANPRVMVRIGTILDPPFSPSSGP